jgi:hypothetical protein
MEFPQDAIACVGPEGDLNDDATLELGMVLAQLAEYAEWASDRVNAIECIAEGLRGEQEWTQGHIEVVASIAAGVADMESDNQWTAEGAERFGANIVADGQDWGCS